MSHRKNKNDFSFKLVSYRENKNKLVIDFQLFFLPQGPTKLTRGQFTRGEEWSDMTSATTPIMDDRHLVYFCDCQSNGGRGEVCEASDALNR